MVGKATSKSAVSRRFKAATEAALSELLARDLSGLETAVLMIDGLDVADQMITVALVITADGTKVPVGLVLGDTENHAVVTDLLADLVARGNGASRPPCQIYRSALVPNGRTLPDAALHLPGGRRSACGWSRPALVARYQRMNRSERTIAETGGCSDERRAVACPGAAA